MTQHRHEKKKAKDVWEKKKSKCAHERGKEGKKKESKRSVNPSVSHTVSSMNSAGAADDVCETKSIKAP